LQQKSINHKAPLYSLFLAFHLLIIFASLVCILHLVTPPPTVFPVPARQILKVSPALICPPGGDATLFHRKAPCDIWVSWVKLAWLLCWNRSLPNPTISKSSTANNLLDSIAGEIEARLDRTSAY
jgi:hypothetical protein